MCLRRFSLGELAVRHLSFVLHINFMYRHHRCRQRLVDDLEGNCIRHSLPLGRCRHRQPAHLSVIGNGDDAPWQASSGVVAATLPSDFRQRRVCIPWLFSTMDSYHFEQITDRGSPVPRRKALLIGCTYTTEQPADVISEVVNEHALTQSSTELRCGGIQDPLCSLAGPHQDCRALRQILIGE
jgi:hypothetical protein